ncbi:tyrosine-type recombinase/integrase [Antribacter sp. KLBMP9083]|uniref:Tyrosine-type recombinase/integrase n=1 Tax=Antribacter soli TaxID=2910976 RepID=A0AA41QHG2_9MICO|nr:tyrosine-type recombinase/integrase [Antribacter soli]MCF4123232.1 tyrosine-type recombinase/integrase [Antribacter soli]
MARTPIAPGRWGRISRKELGPNVWRAQVLYRDFAGNLHKLEARGRSGATAQHALEDKLHQLSSDDPFGGLTAIEPGTRMSDVFDQWSREKRAEGQVLSQSMNTYLGTLDRVLRPALGGLRVREVTPVAVNRVLMALVALGKYDTARQARNVLTQVMTMCVRYGAAPFNPVRDAVTVRKPKRPEVRTLELRDIATLRKAVRAWEDRPAKTRGRRNITLLPQIVDTMLGTGLRIGECLALRQDDLRLDAEVPTLTVTGTVVRVEETTAHGTVQGRLVRQSKPKSDASRRTITLPEFVVTALRQAIDLGLDGGPDKLVFPSTKGTPRSPARVREQLQEAREGTGVKVTPHDFRRTVATRVANETTIGNASALLGHADEGTTVRHYVRRTHVAPDMREVIDQLVQQADEREGPETKTE